MDVVNDISTLAVVVGWVLKDGETVPDGSNGMPELTVTIEPAAGGITLEGKTGDSGAFIIPIFDFSPGDDYVVDVEGRQFEVDWFENDDGILKEVPMGRPHGLPPLALCGIMDKGALIDDMGEIIEDTPR